MGLDVGGAYSSPAPAPNSGARATQASTLPAVRGPRCVLLRAPMAGKLLSLLPPLLLAAVGLAGLLLLCVPTQDVREPPALKVHAPTVALVWEAAGWGWGAGGELSGNLGARRNALGSRVSAGPTRAVPPAGS